MRAFLFLLFCLTALPLCAGSASAQVPGSDVWDYEVSKAIALSLADTPDWEYAMPYLREIGPKTTDWNLLLFQAKVEHQRGDIEVADITIHRALRSAPKNPRVLALAGNIAVDMDRRDEAVEHFAGALAAQPDNAAVLLSLSRLRFARREWDEVIADLEHLLQLVPPTSEICVRLATAYENRGDLENAERYLKKNVAIHPNRRIALIPLERFYRAHGMTERADAVTRELHALQYHDSDRREMRALKKSSK